MSTRRILALSPILLTLSFTARAQIGSGKLQPPKVPFDNKPCEALTTADQASLKMPTPLKVAADRAPAKLTFDNVCSYSRGGTLESQVMFQTKGDYDMNSTGNRSTEKQAPADLPGAFYDKQGGLWFAKNGYYVVVSGRREWREPVARTIAKKL